MEEFRTIAYAHYSAAPPAVKALSHDFFRALDANQDGQVSLHEFLALMRHQGHTRLANPTFFRELDRNGNGSLDFWEVLILYYIIKSGRPLCECCGILVPGTFFSCVECFDSPVAPSYSLCIYCYTSNKSVHNHDDRQQFLDTYTLLETKKGIRRTHLNEQSPSQLTMFNPAQATHHMYDMNVPRPQWPNAIVPAEGMNRWKAAKAALKALEIGLSIGSISTTLCTIL